MPRSKVPALAPLAIERQQRLDIGVARPDGDSARRQRREDASGRTASFASATRPAAGTAKMRSLRPAPRGAELAVRQPRVVERALDLDAAQVARRAGFRNVHAGGIRAQERQARRLVERRGAVEERDHAPRADRPSPARGGSSFVGAVARSRAPCALRRTPVAICEMAGRCGCGVPAGLASRCAGGGRIRVAGGLLRRRRRRPRRPAA